MPSSLKVGSLIKPSDVAFMTALNVGVISILHLIVSFKLMVLLVPDIPAPESTIQFECANCALFIATGAMNMDISVRQSNIQLTCYKYHGNSVKSRLRCSLLNCNYTLQVLQQVATND